MTGVRSWFRGKATCVPHLRARALESPGDWRMVPTSANGQPAVVAYLRGALYAVAVLTVAGDRLAGIAVFADPAVTARFT
jgi:RNA polymerase sigma-70 factor (ECF subfamily)